MAHPIDEATTSQLEILLARAWRRRHTTRGRRAHRGASLAAIIALGLHGLRVAEACRLKRRDLSQRNRVIYVRTLKGGRPRRLHLDPEFGDCLLALAGPHAADPLIPDRTGKHRNETITQRRVTLWLRMNAGPYTSHSLRHTAARRCWEATHDAIAVMNMLGHRTLATTTAYLINITPTIAGMPTWPTPWDKPTLRLHA